MSGYCPQPGSCEDLRLEYVTVSVGFDDLLDHTLCANRAHCDTVIVVTSHGDRKTQALCRKHSVTCVPTDLMTKDNRHFNKGAAINAGMNYFRFYGWRMHLDADIMLPKTFRQVLFNHTTLDRSVLYGADRVNVIGKKQIHRLMLCEAHQHNHSFLVESGCRRDLGARYCDLLSGYLPLGFFQMWHATQQRNYPWSLGSAAHDDIMFSMLWPREKRQLLPTAVVYHLCPDEPQMGQNWEGRKSRRLK